MANDSAILDAFKFDQTVDCERTGRKMRVGIIGCGGIANSHVKAYLTLPDVEIVAGCDLIPGKARAFMDKYGLTDAKTDYASHKEMLEDESLQLDAVSVCTYNRQHKEPTIMALRKGVGVLLEKPFTVTLDEAVEIMKVEKETGTCLTIGFQPRFDENMKMLKRIVESGVLGDIYYIQTGGGRRRGIPVNRGTSFIENETAGLGALADIGCYSIDMLMNALGHPKPVTVTGYTSSFFGKDPNYVRYQQLGHPEYAEKFEVDDFGAGFIRYENGMVLDFRISWAMNIDTPGDTIILGTKGGLRLPSTECWNGSLGGPMKLYYEQCGEQLEVEIPLKKTKKTLFEHKVRTFIDAVRDGTPPPVPSKQIIYNQAVIDGIARSAACGHEVEVVIPEI